MSPSNNTTTTTATSTTTNDDVWDSQALGASDLQGLDGSFSNVMDEDFLLMDGLEIEDDFTGLLDLTPADAFPVPGATTAPESDDSAADSEPSMDMATDMVAPLNADGKRTTKSTESDDDDDESNTSSPRKRRRSSQSEDSFSVCSMALSDTSSVVSARPSLDLTSAPAPTNDDFKAALKQLALSMQRSELTRNEIIRQRKLAERQGHMMLPAPATAASAPVSPTHTSTRLSSSPSTTTSSRATSSSSFLGGTRSTLTVGLEQSRRMLKSYMGQVKML